MSIKMTGTEKVSAGIRKYRVFKVRQMERGMRRGMELVFKESQRLVPVDTGHLKGTGRIVKKKTKFTTVYAVEYATPYAVYVHENLAVFHLAPTQAKFVEEPARRLLPQVRNTIKMTMKEKR